MNHLKGVSLTKPLEAATTRSRERFLLLLLVCIIALPYLNALGNGFVSDDVRQIVSNEAIRSPGKVLAYFSSSEVLSRLVYDTRHYRPLFWLSLALDYMLWGLHPFGYHLTNLLLHLVNTFLVYLLMRRLVSGLWPAFLTSLLWGLHPVHTEAVTWISGRTATLSTTFALTALLLFLTRQERRACWKNAAVAGGAACVAFALLTYEGAVSLPALALFLDWVRSRQEGRAWHPDPAHLLLWAVLASYVLLRFTLAPLGTSVSTLSGLTADLGPRVLRAPSILVAYLKLLAYPIHLSMDHAPEIPRPASLWEPAVWGPFSLLLALAWMAWRLRRRSWAPLMGLGWFAVAIAPVANVLPLYRIIAERYIYLPAIGLIFAATVAAGEGVELLNRAFPRYPLRRFAAALLVALLCLYGLRIHRRNWDWKDNLTLHSSTVATTPNSFIGWNNLGDVQWQQGRLDEAIASFRRAAALLPNYGRVHNNLGALYLLRGEVQAALGELQLSVALDPHDAGARSNLALAYLRTERPEEAIAEFQKAVELNPAHATFRYHLALAYLKAGQTELAISELRRGLDIEPQHALIRETLRRVIGGDTLANPSDIKGQSEAVR